MSMGGMRQVREIIRLGSAGVSKHQIARGTKPAERVSPYRHCNISVK
jgi:hypothetical protein